MARAELDAGEVRFTPRRAWTRRAPASSTRCSGTSARAPRASICEPLLDDQENDTRLSTGAIYWEGAVRALEGAALVGRGYLELTGYGERLQLR
jgi:hypothetical protein